jgi:hypothetical protein
LAAQAALVLLCCPSAWGLYMHHRPPPLKNIDPALPTLLFIALLFCHNVAVHGFVFVCRPQLLLCVLQVRPWQQAASRILAA